MSNSSSPHLVKYQTLPVWTKDTLPTAFRKKHNTKKGTWARLTIGKGRLKYYALNESGDVQSTQVFSSTNPPPFIEPQAWHKVEPLTDDLECFLEFYCRPEQYYQKRYNLSAPHSEVMEVLNYIQSGDALDLGSGRGRNSIFLHQNGFRVTALDKHEEAMMKLQKIIDNEEECRGIQAEVYDIQSASLKKDYDLIISTVVFQFLRRSSINSVIQNMQEHTQPGGYNLIVAPISSEDCPCPIAFPFTFKENELKEYYNGWNICKYNENPGEFHKTDQHGNFHQARFATVIARKRN